jgi:hypothetical protein
MMNTDKNPAAVALGRRGAGKPKTLTPEQRARLAAHMRLVAKPGNERRKAEAAEKAAIEQSRDWEDDSKQYQPV